MSSVAVAEQFKNKNEVFLSMACRDPNAFIEYVLQDEETGGIVSQADIHNVWQKLVTKHDRLLIWSHVESGKTTQLSIGRTLFELGRNPALRIAIVSNTHGQAAKVVRTIARYIEHSEPLHAVFPKLVKSDPWQPGGQLFIKRPMLSKDPSVQAFGVHGAVLGARIDILILDDILDFENCRTPAQRDDLWDWYHATLAGRLTRDARVWVIGTAFHPDDTLHRFARLPSMHAVRFPILDPKTGQSRWPERWSLERIEERRANTPPVEFARQMLCVARDDGEARFKQEWIDLAIKAGEQKNTCYALEKVPPGCKVYTGVDLAVQRHASAGETVLFSVLIHPNGNREVLNIEAGKWTGPDIVQRIIDAHRRYLSICIVENNAAQDFIIQFARGEYAVPIKPFTTGRNKAHPEFGIESIAAEMAGGKWIIPSMGGIDPQIQEWITEMLYYDPRTHTGDRLMASWFAQEGARMGTHKVEFGRIDLMSR